MEKVITITDKQSSDNNRDYWMSKTPQERLEAIEFLRQQYMEYTNAPQRMQKVLTITNMKNKNVNKFKNPSGIIDYSKNIKL